MNDHCIFCRIIAGEIPSSKVYEDENYLAIRDVNPQAAIHVLVMPKRHVENILEAAEDPQLTAGLFATVARVADVLGMKEDGFRLVTNVGQFGCQSVKHLHLHLLGGEQLADRMS